MRLKIRDPLSADATLVIRFNGQEVRRINFLAGEVVKLEYSPPDDISGEVRFYMLQAGEERGLPGFARFTREDLKGALMRVEDAEDLKQNGNTNGAREKLTAAIALFELHAPGSEDLAKAKEQLALLGGVAKLVEGEPDLSAPCRGRS